MDLCFHPVLVPLEVKDDRVFSEKARVRVSRFHVRGPGPLRFFDFKNPCAQGRTQIRVVRREFLEQPAAD